MCHLLKLSDITPAAGLLDEEKHVAVLLELCAAASIMHLQ
jgi:hypothetical protein